jgi:hypothetical protein
MAYGWCRTFFGDLLSLKEAEARCIDECGGHVQAINNAEVLYYPDQRHHSELNKR